MAAQTSSGSEETISAINVTPLVDVVLVLLIILMVTATAVVAKTVPLDLPQASTGSAAQAPLVVAVDRHGGLFLGDQPTDEAQLRKEVRAQRRKQPRLQVIIAAAKQVPHGRVVAVMDLLRSEQVTRFAIRVDEAEKHTASPS